MAQSYVTLLATTTLAASLAPLIDRDDAAASCFSGTSFPSTNLLLGQFCYRTDQLKMYQLTNLTGPVWTLAYDLSSGTMVAAVASAVAWSGITGKPTTVSGYGISDALLKTGDTATGKITLVTSAAGAASVTLPHGVAPTTPVNGDMWTATTGLFARINGASLQFSALSVAETYAAKKTFVASTTTSASANVAAGTAPTTPVDGDIWATGSQLVYRMGGVSKNIAFWDASSLIPVANGGTGANNSATARTNLGIVNPPAGALMPYAGTSEPAGWFFCDGRSLSTTTYSTLFAAIGYAYGGSGATFNLPDLRGRVPAGRDDMGGASAGRLNSIASTTLGGAGGSQSHTLGISEMPAHNHFVASTFSGTAALSSTNYLNDEALYNTDANARYRLAGSANTPVSGLTSSAGSGGAHNNVQPTIVLNYIIKV